MDISLRGELWDNDSADVLRWWGFRAGGTSRRPWISPAPWSGPAARM